MITITPSEGKYLTNGEVYTDSIVYLGVNDSIDNWQEVDEIPIPEDEATIEDYEEALGRFGV